LDFYTPKIKIDFLRVDYVDKVITKDNADSLLAASCVYDSRSGDIILKLVNAGQEAKSVKVNLRAFGRMLPTATLTQLSGAANAENSFQKTGAMVPVTTAFKTAKQFDYTVPAVSLTVIRIKTR